MLRARAGGTATAAAIVTVALIAGCQPNDARETRGPPPSGETTAMLHVALQDGFDDDRVQIRLNGESIYERSGVSTDYRISRADALEVPLRDGPMRLAVTLPDRDLSGAVEVRGDGPVYVGVTVADGTVQFRLSDQPFGYL